MASEEPVVLALPKGRLLERTVELFARAGYDLSPVLEKRTRRLVHDCGALQAWILRSADVPTYVDHGAADVGIVGNDVLDEQPLDLHEPVDLGIGKCRLIVAEPSASPVDERASAHLRVATKYPNITRRYLERRGIHGEVIKLSGSVELGPLTGLSDRIVDLVETGETLRQNGLVEVDTVMHVSARLVVNPARLKLRGDAISRLIGKLAAAVQS